MSQETTKDDAKTPARTMRLSQEWIVVAFMIGWFDTRPTIDHRKFGRLLSVARESLALSRADVAHALYISVESYSDIEHGKATVSLLLLAKLRQELGLDINFLLQALPVNVPHVAKRIRKSSHKVRRKFGRYHLLGRELIRHRIASKLTQSGVAYALDLSLRQVMRIEGGHRLPSLERFARLHRLFGFDANKLLDCLLEPPTDEPYHRFGAVIQASREALGMTPTNVAKKAHCHQRDYERIECGAILPTFDVFVQLHRVLRFDADIALRAVWEWKNHRGKRTG